MPNNNYPCKDNLCAHCGALGEALRRASEAERKVEELEKEVQRLFAYIDGSDIFPRDIEALKITRLEKLRKAGIEVD